MEGKNCGTKHPPEVKGAKEQLNDNRDISVLAAHQNGTVTDVGEFICRTLTSVPSNIFIGNHH